MFDFLLNRGNDLTEVFWPVFYFIRESIYKYHQIPLWNNLIFAGTPILPDPQFSLFYPPNFVFYIFPISLAFIIHLSFHLTLGAFGMYYLTKKILKLNTSASLFAAFYYILTPRVSGYLEAGHFTLIASYAWLPFLVASIIDICRNPKYKNSILFGISLAGLFFTHTLIFASSFVISIFIFIYLFVTSKSINRKSLFFIAIGLAIALGLSLITLIPQVKWLGETTRQFIFNTPITYPQWLTKKEYLIDVFLPFVKGIDGIWKIETEKWITLGTGSSLLAILGFLKLSKSLKISILILFLTILILSLNNLLPVYSLLLSQKWFLLLRVSTRLWFINNFLISVLAAVAISKLKKPKLIVFFALFEIAFLSLIYLAKPIENNPNLAPKEIYEYLKDDQSLFRVLCVTRCLSQKQSAIYDIELVDGYNTLQQTNYLKHSWQLFGGYWNYYTLYVPPIGFVIKNPDIKSLGEYNVKYIISPSEFNIKDLEFKIKIKDFYIYENKLSVLRNYEIYTPNFIRINISNTNHKTQTVVIPEVYSRGWKAYLNGVEEVPIQETPNALRAVDIKPDTNFIDFHFSISLF